jgi:phosphoglycerate dehydrogenase-like enzyme
MPRVLITTPFPEAMVQLFKKLVGEAVEVDFVTTPAEDEFLQKIAGADILVNGFRKIDAATLDKAPQVKFIQQIGVGYNNLDLALLRERGILAANTPGVNAESVAEHTILLMLALLKRFEESVNITRANKWSTIKILQGGVTELGAATVGLIGFGSTGQAVAARLKPFGSRVLYTTRRRVSPEIEERLGVSYATLPELLAASSIVSLHLPLNAETRNLISEKELALMPPGSFLVNTARGDIVDEAALRQAVLSGHLGGAGLDVLQTEKAGSNPFTDLPQVTITPHTAGASRSVMIKAAQMSAGNVTRYLSGERPLYILPELQDR